MDWVEGLRLDEFLTDCLAQPNYRTTLRKLCDMWLRMAGMLREANVGHGDLQHGNVLLVPVPDKEAYNLKLIDYDGMYVPELADDPPGEVGHPAYQHPQRLTQGGYGPEIDRFAHLLIYTTLRCLIVGGRGLWIRYHDGDRLLTGPQDLAAPEDSHVLRVLWQIPEPSLQSLVGHLILAAKGPLEYVPGLDELVVDSRVVPLTEAQRGQVDEWMSTGTPWIREATQIVADPTETSLQAEKSETPSPAASQDKPTQSTLTEEPTIETSAPSVDAAPRRPPPLPGKRETVASVEEVTVAAAELGPSLTSRTRRLGTRIYSAGAVSVRWVDRALQHMAGREHVVLHNFLRCIAVVMCLALPVLAVMSVSRVATTVAENTMTVWRSLDAEIREGIGAIEKDDSGGESASETETDPSDDGRVEDENGIGDGETAGTEAPEETRSPPPPLAIVPFDAEQAAQHQREWAEYLGLPVEITNSIGMRLVLIPPGEFLMGSPDGEESPSDDEFQHRVRISVPFYLGVHEVTQEQWESVMGNNPSQFRWRQNPVENVSWNDCQAFLDKLTEESWDGRGKFGLPTEAQWEYACRAGTTTRYNFGDDEASLGEYAWYQDNSAGRTHPAGEREPNAWGLYDMYGNVWEWCQDLDAPDYDGGAPADEPFDPFQAPARVLRGGSWLFGASYCPSAYRTWGVSQGGNQMGFRVALDLPYAGKLTDEPMPEEKRQSPPLTESPGSESQTPKPATVPSPENLMEGSSTPGDLLEASPKRSPPTTGQNPAVGPLPIVARERFVFDRRGWTSWVAFSPNGSLVFTMPKEDVVTVWDTATGKKLGEMDKQQPGVVPQRQPDYMDMQQTGKYSLAFSPDGSRVVVGGTRVSPEATDGMAKIWDVTAGRELRTIVWKETGITSVAFSPDGQNVFTGSANAAAVWGMTRGRSGHSFSNPGGTVVSIACSPDGKKVLAGCSTGSAILWDASTRKELHTFQGHNGPVRAVAFSRDGSQLLTGGNFASRNTPYGDYIPGEVAKGIVILRDSGSGQELRRFSGLSMAFALSPDNTQVLAGNQLFNATSGERIASFATANLAYAGSRLPYAARAYTRIDPAALFPGMMSVAFSPNGREVFIATKRGVYSGTIPAGP